MDCDRRTRTRTRTRTRCVRGPVRFFKIPRSRSSARVKSRKHACRWSIHSSHLQEATRRRRRKRRKKTKKNILTKRNFFLSSSSCGHHFPGEGSCTASSVLSALKLREVLHRQLLLLLVLLLLFLLLLLLLILLSFVKWSILEPVCASGVFFFFFLHGFVLLR